MRVLILLLGHLSFRGPEISLAISPGCTCIEFSQMHSKDGDIFTSPDYPKNYPRGIDCLLYVFIAGPEQIVEVTFAVFDIHKTHLDCANGDNLKVYPHVKYNELDEFGEAAGTLCGGRTDVPTVIFSNGNALILKFHSTSAPAVNTTGFYGFYQFINRKLFKTSGELKNTPCDYLIDSSKNSKGIGYFYSPNYPSSYPKNRKCRYHFTTRSEERIRLVFKEILLQKGDDSCLYQDDVIKVYDGANTESPVINIFCNEVSETEILSTSSDLLVELTTKSAWPGQGFRGIFQFQKMDIITPLVQAHLEASTTNPLQLNANTPTKNPYKTGPILCSKRKSFGPTCDAAFNSDTSKNGSFTSSNYPSSYPPRSHCRYDFMGRGKERVQVVFQDFSLFHPGDDVKECDSIDSLQAFVHIDGRMEKIDSFCGSTIPKPIMSNGPRLMLEFRGIYSSRYARGFKAAYYFLENFAITNGKQLAEFPCAFIYNSSTARNGSFNTPNFPGPYPRDTECHYFFHGNNNEKVHIHFTYFDVEGVLPCEAMSASDYVEFSNFMARDRKYNRHCGQLKDFHVESDRKFFRVTFKSNDRLDGTGFNATYQFIEEVEATTYRPKNGHNRNNYGSSLHLVILIIVSMILSQKHISWMY